MFFFSPWIVKFWNVTFFLFVCVFVCFLLALLPWKIVELAVQNRAGQIYEQQGHKQILKERERDVPLTSILQQFRMLGEYEGN